MMKLRYLIMGLIVAILLIQHRDRLVGWNNKEIDVANMGKKAEYIAISLPQLQKAVKDAQSSGLTMDTDLKFLFGITEFKGISYKPLNGECVLFGISDKAMPPIDINDFVVALKEVFTNNVPGVTIDPEDPRDFGGLQRVKFFGKFTDQSQFGYTLFDCDYHLKRLAAAIIPTSVSDFKSYYELVLNEYKQEIKSCNGNMSPHEDSNRFWFYPTKPRFAKKGNTITVKEFGVQVLTEKQLINKSKGKIVNLKGQKSKHASSFANSFSNSYDEIAAVHSRYKKLKSLFNVTTVLRLMYYEKIALKNVDYFLSGYQVPSYETPDTVDGINLTRNLSHPINNYPYSEECIHTLYFSGGCLWNCLLLSLIFLRIGYGYCRN
ncbi:MAG: hypothetical protein SCARUB_03961 [Candidatus Scalindua rubra]|uniref:Uncharacterized protein n=1 Tax=Candidatus Scalindua rubra TaxID=1872076 RepID=A0A1E3X5R5_9BACT|nr:MAG: hypothetical protein SCARUB_03961 [Candidatus Scalindua rubra]